MPLIRTVLFGSCLLLVGCGKSPTKVGDNLATVDPHSWVGTYQNASASGDLVLDVVQTGTDVKGEVVYGEEPTLHFFVLGTRTGDSLHLQLDPNYGPYTFTYALYAQVRTDGGLDGGMRLSSGGFEAEVHARSLARRQAVLEATFDVPYDVISMAFDGTLLWLGTSFTDYVRLTPAGTVVDTVKVFYRNAHWTSSTLVWDGSEMWGTLPGNLITPSANLEYDEVLGFNSGGRTGDSLRIWHRSQGLAYDGVDFWSLGNSTLRRFDRAGTIVDSVHSGVPDAIHLDYSGGTLWTLGWSMRRLYELQTDGNVASIADLPGAGDPAGIAIEGSHIWVARAHVGYSTLYRFSVAPGPVRLASR
jgi:hypothetical protein